MLTAGNVSAQFQYPSGRTHSPLTREILAHLQSIAAQGPAQKADVFSKVGDSNTAAVNALSCFAGNQVDFGGREELVPAWQHFREGRVSGRTPFNRLSLSAAVGWSAFSALVGNRSPLQQELEVAQPRFATVMFGTNDLGYADTQRFARNLLAIVDSLSARGVIPLISSIPPRDDSAAVNAWVPRYNLVARGIAQARHVPFLDLHRELLALPSHGLNPDGVHLNTYVAGGPRPCVLTEAGLAFGHNTRNRLVLEALSRSWLALKNNVAPDSPPSLVSGSGTPGDKIVISTLPFVDMRHVEAALFYRLELTRPTTVRIFSMSASAAAQLRLGDARSTPREPFIVRHLNAGTHELMLSAPQSGEFGVAVLEEPAALRSAERKRAPSIWSQAQIPRNLGRLAAFE